MSQALLDESYLPTTVTSPFVPGTKLQYAWDSTSLGLLKTCPRLYQYTMLDGWSPKGESVHLRFGQEYHSALQQYDILKADGQSHERAVEIVVRDLISRTVDFSPDADTKAGRYKSRENLIQLVIDYLDHFNNEPLETYILSTGKPAVELSFRFELPFSPELRDPSGFLATPTKYLLCGHLDKVVDYGGTLFVMDHKTTITTPSQYYFAQYEPNNQMTLYTIGGKVILNSPVKGVIISAAQILLEKPNAFIRGFTYRTDDQLAEWLDDLQVMLTVNEAYVEQDYWPMNDTSCDKFGGCRFRDICSKSPNVREMFLKTDFVKLPPEERWNPLNVR